MAKLYRSIKNECGSVVWYLKSLMKSLNSVSYE